MDQDTYGYILYIVLCHTVSDMAHNNISRWAELPGYTFRPARQSVKFKGMGINLNDSGLTTAAERGDLKRYRKEIVPGLKKASVQAAENYRRLYGNLGLTKVANLGLTTSWALNKTRLDPRRPGYHGNAESYSFELFDVLNLRSIPPEPPEPFPALLYLSARHALLHPDKYSSFLELLKFAAFPILEFTVRWSYESAHMLSSNAIESAISSPTELSVDEHLFNNCRSCIRMYLEGVHSAFRPLIPIIVHIPGHVTCAFLNFPDRAIELWDSSRNPLASGVYARIFRTIQSLHPDFLAFERRDMFKKVSQKMGRVFLNPGQMCPVATCMVMLLRMADANIFSGPTLAVYLDSEEGQRDLLNFAAYGIDLILTPPRAFDGMLRRVRTTLPIHLEDYSYVFAPLDPTYVSRVTAEVRKWIAPSPRVLQSYGLRAHQLPVNASGLTDSGKVLAYIRSQRNPT